MLIKSAAPVAAGRPGEAAAWPQLPARPLDPSLDKFLGQHISEDNASFAEIQEASLKRRRAAKAWLFEDRNPTAAEMGLLLTDAQSSGSSAAAGAQQHRLQGAPAQLLLADGEHSDVQNSGVTQQQPGQPEMTQQTALGGQQQQQTVPGQMQKVQLRAESTVAGDIAGDNKAAGSKSSTQLVALHMDAQSVAIANTAGDDKAAGTESNTQLVASQEYAGAIEVTRAATLQAATDEQRVPGAMPQTPGREPVLTDGYGTTGQEAQTIVTWPYVNKNTLYYDSSQRPNLALSVRERAALVQGPPKAIVHSATRFAAAHDGEAGVSEAADGAAQRKVAGLGPSAQAPVGGRANAGYGAVNTPTFTPGVDASPIMTWGDIESTPMRLAEEDDIHVQPSTGGWWSKGTYARCGSCVYCVQASALQ